MTSFQQNTGSVISALWRAPKRKINSRAQVLLYHSIGGVAIGDQKGLYSVDVARFTRQMNLLSKLQDEGLLTVVPFGQESAGTLSITFDDGYSDNVEVAEPILERLGFPFHIFLNPTLIENQVPGFLQSSEIKSLSNNRLLSLGLHGYSHQPLVSLSNLTIENELDAAKDWFVARTGSRPTSFSYPHGSTDNRIIKLIKNHGFEMAACSKFGPITSDTDNYLIPRIDIWSTDSDHTFLGKLRGKWDWMRWRT